MQSDVESVSSYVIDQMKRKGIALTEGERKRIIGVGIGTLKRDGLRMAREQVEWETQLIGATRSAYNEIDLSKYQRIVNKVTLVAFLGSMGAALHRDSKGYWVELPKGYAVSETAKKIREIIRA